MDIKRHHAKATLCQCSKKVNQRAQAARDECAWANSHSAFFQASYLLEIIESNGAFIDLPLVEPQDQEMTEATSTVAS